MHALLAAAARRGEEEPPEHHFATTRPLSNRTTAGAALGFSDVLWRDILFVVTRTNARPARMIAAAAPNLRHGDWDSRVAVTVPQSGLGPGSARPTSH